MTTKILPRLHYLLKIIFLEPNPGFPTFKTPKNHHKSILKIPQVNTYKSIT